MYLLSTAEESGDEHSEPSQTSKMDFFAKTVHRLKPLGAIQKWRYRGRRYSKLVTKSDNGMRGARKKVMSPHRQNK